jgi:predicted O-methyltransferase YrrM
MMKPITQYGIEKPSLVIEAEKLAGELGFPLLPEGRPVGHDGPPSACVPAMGALLMTLAAAKPGGRIGEFGTGSGVGSAWIASGLQAGAVLVTCDIDGDLIHHVKALFKGRDAVDIRQTDWEEIMVDETPFDLLFMDSGVAEVLVPDRWDEITELVRVGGQIIFDDIVPTELWPDEWSERVDMKREFAFRNPRLVSSEVGLTSLASALIVTRIA